MARSQPTQSAALEALDALVAAVRQNWAAALVQRWRADAAAAIFQLRSSGRKPILLCILGGTGTGKSTLVNRLLGDNVCAASFRRTFTAGPVAVAARQSDVPEQWLGIAHAPADSLPARGQVGTLVVVECKNPLLSAITLVDTPDLDGDQPAHHAQADRVFRWSQAVLFLVSPEKYQMTELLPYYRLARRYAVPALCVMNKCESAAMLEDYRTMLGLAESDVFCVARDDAAYEPPTPINLDTLRQRMQTLEPASGKGNELRVADVLGRLRDQVLGPLRDTRKALDGAAASLKSMETPASGVDVNPITEQLQRRLQQRSVLYLIGPGRMLDRVRQVPAILARLPRTTWDLIFHGKAPAGPDADSQNASGPLPDFARLLVDQFTIVQSRIEDIIRGAAEFSPGSASPAAMLDEPGLAALRIDPAQAAKIAQEELDQLRDWLQKRWDATPRDTVLLLRLLRHLPGGQKLTQWTEAAPYLLAVIVATHHAFFGHVDLMILGGYTVATWLSERLSNEVAARARAANRAIAERFERLVHEQIARGIEFVHSLAPSGAQIQAIAAGADELEESLES